MKKTSEEIEEDRMNENYKRFSEFWEKARNIVDEEGYKILDWDKSNIANYCFTKGFEQAQKQERLECYKKFIDELGTLWAKGYGTAYDMPREFLEKLIKFYEKEIKILEGK